MATDFGLHYRSRDAVSCLHSYQFWTPEFLNRQRTLMRKCGCGGHSWWALLVGTPSGQPNEGPQTLVPVGHPPPPKFLRFSVAVLTAEARPPGAPSTFLLSLVGLEFPGQNLPAIITAPRSTCFLSCSLWMSDLALRNKNPIGTAASFFLLSAMRCQKWTYY